MSDLAAFYAARLDEDEAAARGAASEVPWSVSETNDDGTRSVLPAEAPDGLWHGDVAGHIAGSDARHIARHDPARVLREVAAGRALLREYIAVRKLHETTGGKMDGYRDWVLRQRVAVYADHPGYDPAWAAEPT